MSETEKKGTKAQMLLIAALLVTALIIPFAKRSADNSPEFQFSTKPMAASELAAYQAGIREMVDKYTVGQMDGLPVVHPPAGSDVYLLARTYSWGDYVLELEQGAGYRLHLASADVKHAIMVKELGLWNSIEPGEIKIVEFIPAQAGRFNIVCGEFCGTNHGSMIGQLIVSGATTSDNARSAP